MERAKPFDAEAQAHLLRQIWEKLRPDDEFVQTGDGWKEIGFQGVDPSTDVRAGGLLAVQVLHQFAMTQTNGLRRMLNDVNSAQATNPDHYYPACCTAVVMVSALSEMTMLKTLQQSYCRNAC